MQNFLILLNRVEYLPDKQRALFVFTIPEIPDSFHWGNSRTRI